MSDRRNTSASRLGREADARPVCPRCGGVRFARSRGLRGWWRNLLFLALCLFLLLPGLVYFARRQQLFLTCRNCGLHFPAPPGAAG